MASSVHAIESTEVTDTDLAEARALIGTVLRNEQFNEVASVDTIRHFAWGAGDDNPLWCDAGYAVGTGFGSVLAPPTWLYSTSGNGVGPGLNGLHGYDIGGTWTWFRPVFEGDRIEAVIRMTGADQWRSRGAAPSGILQRALVEYWNQRRERVATLEMRTLRVARRGLQTGLRYEPRAEYEYSEEELSAIEADVRAETRRGAAPLFADDVRVGETLVPVVKGPLDTMARTVWYAGCVGGPTYRGVELAWHDRILAREDPEKLPNNVWPASFYRGKVAASSGHANPDVAVSFGMPGAYDNGARRASYILHCVTNWMGDAAFLRTYDVKLRRPVIDGDTMWCSGTVSGVGPGPVAGTGTVTVDLACTNQNGELVSDGSCEVWLLARGAGSGADTVWKLMQSEGAA